MKAELELVENIDSQHTSRKEGALYAVELRLIPKPGASCIRFSTQPTKEKKTAIADHAALLAFLKDPQLEKGK